MIVIVEYFYVGQATWQRIFDWINQESRGTSRWVIIILLFIVLFSNSFCVKLRKRQKASSFTSQRGCTYTFFFEKLEGIANLLLN